VSSNSFASLVEMAEDSFRRFASRPRFGTRRDGTWSWTSFADLATAVDEVRGGLAALGVHAGDRVAIVSRNSASLFVPTSIVTGRHVSGSIPAHAV